MSRIAEGGYPRTPWLEVVRAGGEAVADAADLVETVSLGRNEMVDEGVADACSAA